MTSPKSSTDPVGAAMRELLLAAKILQQNSEGCATNHYGHDCELNGLPGWLADTKKAIMKAEAALSTPPAQAITEAMVEAALNEYSNVYDVDIEFGRYGDNKEVAMRAALEAAFRVRPVPSDDAQKEAIPAQYRYLKYEPKTVADDGWNACILGAERNKNPHGPTSLARTAWFAGFDECSAFLSQEIG